jgi:DNA-binding transcriptional MerR regulator
VPDDGLVPIGELARRTGVATSALRYYERIGLLSPARRVGQRRQYQESSAERVALIRLYQDAGFTLAEIGRLLADGRRGRRGWTQLAELKIAEVDARIADTQRAKRLIEHALECPNRDLFTCPNFRSALAAHLRRPREPAPGSPPSTLPQTRPETTHPDSEPDRHQSNRGRT